MRKILVAGIDEAGRGAILGPLVMACVLATKEQEEELLDIGVKDSKELSPDTRTKLERKIKDIVESYAVVKITPQELNELMPRKSLNEIEAMKAAQLLQELTPKPEIVIVDAPDIIAENFSKRIKRFLSLDVIIKAEHFADSNYAIVGAASILAKVARDSEIEALKKRFGNVGSGYWHDPLTKSFVQGWVEKHKALPECARIYWEPSVQTLNKKLQKTLGEF
jgi:ribonuclease HII